MFVLALLACGGTSAPDPAPTPVPEPAAAEPKHKGIFGALPDHMHKGAVPDAAVIDLGRQLYYDKRLSKNHDISCNSCHMLDAYGNDNKPFSPGHKGQLGGRSSPTTYNAALHIAQFWDGREPDVEAQAKGPVLNPVEMAMASDKAVVDVLKSIPGYVESFGKAFPGDDPVTYQHMADAIGAFERGLVTPAPFDAYMKGDVKALNAEQIEGLDLFVSTGCITCHMGNTLGGSMYQKLGLVKAYETKDLGRFEHTKKDADKYFFKVPSLRNIEKTGPYFHDGSIKTLEEAVQKMAQHQLGKELTGKEVRSIVTFLGSLTGTPDAAYIKEPSLPKSGPKTPKADPN